jgi:hypothetical protein
MAIHIGSIIRDYCRTNLISPPKLAGILKVHPVSVYNIFKRADMRSSMLLRVSTLLRHDFFQYYQSALPDNLPARYEKLTAAHQKLRQQHQDLQKENELLKKVLALPKS